MAAFIPYYGPDGYANGVVGGTLVSAESLDHTDAGVATAQATADQAIEDAAAALAAAGDVAVDVAGLGMAAFTNDYSDLDGLPTLPDSAADVGALPANVRIWNGATWSSRPTVDAGWTVEGYSDGSYGSTWDPDAIAPTGAVEGDAWNRTY